MDVAQVLGYEDSPKYLSKDEDFPHSQLGYVLRKAREECGLKGAYVLKEGHSESSPVPILYFCQANSEQEAAVPATDLVTPLSLSKERSLSG